MYMCSVVTEDFDTFSMGATAKKNIDVLIGDLETMYFRYVILEYTHNIR